MAPNSKIVYYSEMAAQAAKQITSSREEWTAFLAASARLYKYPYHEQLMIFRQRPTAIACADFNIWSKKMRRHIKRGAKGIALLDITGDYPKIRYVFDVSDTDERTNSRPLYLWRMNEEHHAVVQSALEAAFVVPASYDLDAQLEMIAARLSAAYWSEHKDEICDCVADSYMAQFDHSDIETSFRNAATISISYALCSRCLKRVDTMFDPEEFQDIFDFNTPATVNALGTAVSSLSSQVFREIEVVIKQYERERKLERNEPERTELSADRGLSSAGAASAARNPQTAGQIRQDAPVISGTEQASPVHESASERSSIPASVGDRRDSTPDVGEAHAGAFEAEPAAGQEPESAGMGTAHEQPSAASGGDHVSGAYSQLNLFQPEQVSEPEAATEVLSEPETLSLEEIHRILRTGSGFEDGKLRIQQFYQEHGDAKARQSYLKKEYGIGGCSYTYLDESRGFIDYSSSGIHVWKYAKTLDVTLKWSVVDEHLSFLIASSTYLSKTEQQKFEEQERAKSGTETAIPEPAQDIELELSKEIEPESEQPAETEEPESEPEPPAQLVENPPKPGNYHITNFQLGEGGAKVKYARNIEAIRTLLALEDEHSFPTPQEQEVLASYVGWGGLADAFDENKSAWTQEYKTLKELLSPEEYAAARASTLNAHYTSPTVIQAIFDGVAQLGFSAGNILEPSMGVGNFFGMLPDTMQNSKLYGVELDSLTGRIAKQLYPNANITIAGFETTDRRDFFDLAVGNVPFGNYQVNDKPYNKFGLSIHNYFFLKSLDQVRAGGIVAFVTSRYTLDSKNPDARKLIAQRAELLGAIRLPNDAFRANAGTSVVSDILFLQKREQLTDIEPDWVHLGLTENDLPINSYFLDHPEMILGELSTENTQYGREALTVKPFENADLAELLHQAISHLEGIYQEIELSDLDDLPEQTVIPASPDVKNYSFAAVDGEVYFRENSIMRPVSLSDTAKERVIGLLQLRSILNDLIAYQLEDYPDSDIYQKQEELSTAYDAFTKKYGLINSRANNKAFADDSSYYLLCSLENIDEDGNLRSKADIFTKRTIRPDRTVSHVDTPAEALAISIGERGKVDIPYMAQLLGKPDNFSAVTEQLRGIIFRDPMHAEAEHPEQGWQTADEYLSGNVRDKLRMARFAAEKDTQYTVNVSALEKAQPKDLDASEIDVRLGATWIDPKYIQQFMLETFQPPFYLHRAIQVKYSSITAEWQITGKSAPSSNDVAAYVTYGTVRSNAYRILEDSLNLKDVRIYDMVDDGAGKQKRVLNKKYTTLAQQKQQAIKSAFRDWIWKDPHRREELVTRYNELFNSTRPREYDGSHIHFVGMNPEIKLRTHQINAIAHVLYGGNTLLAHEVGAGKTYEMVAAAMESKRLCLCQKSLFVVPNHLTLQWANEFLSLYPSAKLLVATKKDFQTANRKKFCARIATGDYDAIIIGHSQFERIPLSPERQERQLEAQIADIEEAVASLKYERGENFTIKQMEKTRKSLQARLEKLQNDDRKDDIVTFEQLGVDRLFVDESQAYKNLFLYTKMRNIAGLSTSESQRSSDMFMKCRYLDELTGGRGVIFASGTPVSNSMTELYTVMRYLQYGTLQQKGLTHFDCWASTFGETTTAIELAPEGTGYRARTRFSKFFNLPELMNMFKEVADIKTSDQLNLPVPEAQFETVVVPPSEHQEEMVSTLSERAAAIHSGNVDASVDNMLTVTSDGRKIGLDQRLMNPLLPDEPNSKVNGCIENVRRIWEQGQEQRLTQIIFCDMSTPKKDGTFNVYDDIKNKLIASGIPEHEVAFIHDADTEIKKKELFAKMRTGTVRILLGSTQKCGAGTNVQNLLVAVHHLDVGWRPADMTQRNGRIIRQGNLNPEVHIFQYVTEKTFDAYLWQTLENKQRFISQIMTSKSPVRSCDDVDEQALSYAEVKALCAGNPLIKEKMDLDVDVARLKVLRADHQSQQFRLEDQLLKYFPAQIEKMDGFIRGFEADIQTVEANPSDNEHFPGMIVRGMHFEDKADAGSALLLACGENKKPSEQVPIGEYRGFQLALQFEPFSSKYQVVLKSAMSYIVELGSDARGNLLRLDHALENIPVRLNSAQEQLANLYAQQQAAQQELGKPFPQEAELTQKSMRLAELDAALNMDNTTGTDEPSQETDDPEPEVDCKPEAISVEVVAEAVPTSLAERIYKARQDSNRLNHNQSEFYPHEKGISVHL